MQYGEWLNEWLENTVKPTVKERTYETYGRIIERKIVPRLGSYELGELTPAVLQACTAELSQAYAANTVNGVVAVLKSSLERARQTGLVEKQFADSIKRPKTAEKQVACFTESEQKKIEAYILQGRKDKLFGILLCLYTGLRIGELLALTWADIDFDTACVAVTKSGRDAWENGKYRKKIDTPKTPTSRRCIPLPRSLLPLLRALKKRSTGEAVVGGAKSVSVRSYQRTFELLLKRLGIAHKGFHALRHTFATRALECGMDVKTLSELLGHKNATVTLNRYTHSLFEHKTAMMNKLGKRLG